MVIFNSYVKLPEGIHHTDLKNMILNMRWMTTWMTTTHRQCFDHGTYDHHVFFGPQVRLSHAPSCRDFKMSIYNIILDSKGYDFQLEKMKKRRVS
jgi:hypothetical protein